MRKVIRIDLEATNSCVAVIDGKNARLIENAEGDGQLDDGKPRLSEDDMARALLGPRGVPGKPDTAKMTPQQEKNMPKYVDPGHTE